MFSLSCRGYSSIRVPHIQFQKRSYCKKPSDNDCVYLFRSLVFLLQSYGKKPYRKLNPYPKSFYFSIAVKMMRESHRTDFLEETQEEVKHVLQKSITESMTKIMTRVYGSKKGVMYPINYYLEMAKSFDGYENYVSEKNKNFKKEIHCAFKLGEDLCHFIARNEVTAAYAIESFFEGPTRADCASAIEAVYAKAILDVIGKDKFNQIFEKRENKLQIRRWGTLNENSSLRFFTEFVNPNISDLTNENELKIGDHICVTGVPWYELKHPHGVMGNLHGIVVGHNTNNEPLIAALGLQEAMTIYQVKQGLVDAYNAEQIQADIYEFKRIKLDLCIKGQKIDHEFIFKNYTVEEISKFDGGVVKNFGSTRLSLYVLAVLKKASLEQDLRKLLFDSKALIAGYQVEVLFRKRR